MQDSCDVLVVGAATSGVYLAWVLARRGHEVLVVDAEARERVGQRLEVIHFDEPTMNALGIPPPRGPPEKISTYHASAVSRLPLFLQRMYDQLERDGVRFAFNCRFREPVVDAAGRVVGARVVPGESDGEDITDRERVEISTRLVVDASGVASAVRTALPAASGVERWAYGPWTQFYVILHYIEWTNRAAPHPPWGTLVPSHLLFLDPGYSDPAKDAILGVIAPESFTAAEVIFEDGVTAAGFPPFTVTKREFAHFPLTRPLHSIVTSGFLCLGDAAAMMNPFLARGIVETWRFSAAAGELLDAALRASPRGPLSREVLWPLNVRYARNHGAKLAFQYMALSFLYRMTRRELTYVFEQVQPVVAGAGNETPGGKGSGSQGGNSSGVGAIVRACVKIIAGILGSQIAGARVGQLLTTLVRAGQVWLHYRHFPRDPARHEVWVRRADELWRARQRGCRTFGTTRVCYP